MQIQSRYSHKGRKPVRTVKISDAVCKATRKGFLGERVSPRVPRVLERDQGNERGKIKPPPRSK